MGGAVAMTKQAEIRELRARVEELEGSIAELRRHHLRLAELTDLVQELLLPVAARDEERIAAAIDKFQQGI
ncbi:MAG TPA: DUF6752 domain-containing protein [Nocardioides sp.]|nr:DUF6752 domain-containing protein [Nocardioides sp.]